MIIDLPRFVAAERPYWDELETMLDEARDRAGAAACHWPRCSGCITSTSAAPPDLARLDTFSTEPRLRAFLESLVSRAYSEIHETRAPLKIRWKSLRAGLSARVPPASAQRSACRSAITLLGCAFGWFAIRQDPQAKAVLMPVSGPDGPPAERVAQEESASDRPPAGHQSHLLRRPDDATTSRSPSWRMAAGITWGAGTLILLFYNGVILGAVVADYIGGGQGVVPRGLAAAARLHRDSRDPAGRAGRACARRRFDRMGQPRTPRAERLRAVSHDLFAIVGGAACLLVWAGMSRLRLAIPSAGAALCTEDRLRDLRTGRAGRLPGLVGGARMTARAQSALAIETPEGVVFSYDLATPVTRALAWAVDADRRHRAWPTRARESVLRSGSSAAIGRTRPPWCSTSRSRSRTGSCSNGAGAGRRSANACSGCA